MAYVICYTSLYNIAKRADIPHVLKRGTTYWSKKHVDAYFAKQAPDRTITEGYTAKEVMEKYGMTMSAVYCMVSEHGVPKKKEKSNVYYSKKHVDAVKQTQEAKRVAEPKYYTIKEAMEGSVKTVSCPNYGIGLTLPACHNRA